MILSTQPPFKQHVRYQFGDSCFLAGFVRCLTGVAMATVSSRAHYARRKGCNASTAKRAGGTSSDVAFNDDFRICVCGSKGDGCFDVVQALGLVGKLRGGLGCRAPTCAADCFPAMDRVSLRALFISG